MNEIDHQRMAGMIQTAGPAPADSAQTDSLKSNYTAAMASSGEERFLSLRFDDIPLEAHRHLCALGNRGLKAATVRDYAARFRCFLAFVIQDHPDRSPGDLVSYVPADTLRRFGDAVYQQVGSYEAIKRVSKLASGYQAIFPGHDFPGFKAELRRLRSLPKRAGALTPRRYALPENEIPAALRFLFEAIDQAVQVSRTGKILGPLKSRNTLRGVVRRYLGALKNAGIDIGRLTAGTLVTVDHLEIYIRRSCDPGSDTAAVQSLYTLQSALRAIDASAAIGTVLAGYGIARFEANRDYETYVPVIERALLEAALSRKAKDRTADEPGALRPSIIATVKYSFGKFHKSIANEPALANVDYRDRDLEAAAACFERTMTHCQTSTVAARLTEVKGALDRIYFETGGLSTEILGERIRELKKEIGRDPVDVPDDVSPRDIERLGRKLIWRSWRLLTGLLAATHAYRELRTLAEQYRNGLLFVVFSVIALRVNNMALLRTGTFIHRGTPWTITIPGEFTKNGETIFQPLPDWMTPLLDIYADVIRPLIASIQPGINEEIFWMSRYGDGLRASAFQDIVPRISLKELDFRIWCHLLRAIEASDSMADGEPGHGTVALRHKGPAVTRSHYQSSQSVGLASANVAGVKGHDRALPVISIDDVRIGRAIR